MKISGSAHADATFRENNEMLNNPEGNAPDYIIITNSKPYFVKHVSDKNPFNTTHFWMDAGYGHAIDGHGDEMEFPGDNTWNPCKLLEIKGKLTILKMWDLQKFENYLENPATLHKRNIFPLIAGGFFGGDAKSVTEYQEVYDKVFNSLLYNNIVDDQSVAYHTYREIPGLFNLVDGSWFDIFKVFPS